MAVVQHDVQSGKHPVLASVLMGILRALDDESTGKSSSSSEDATSQHHDRGGPPCRRLRHGKSSQAEMKRAEEYIIPPDEEMAPIPDFSLSDSIRTPPGSPHLHTIIETEEEGEDGDKKEESLIAERAESLEEKKMDAVKNLQKEEVKVRSSTSSPLVTSDDSDVAAFLSKDEYATLFGPNSVNSDKILIPSRFVQDYGETSSSVKISQKSPLKRGSGEELQGNQVKKQKSDHKPVGSSLEALGGTGVHSDETKETGSSLGSPSQRKSPKTEEESDFSSEETLSDTMSDDTVEESTASSILDDRQVGAPGRRKKKLTKTLKSLRIDSPDADGMSDLFSDGQMRNLRPSMMPGPKLVLGSNGWKSDARNEAKSILQKAVSTSLEDFSDMSRPDQSSTVHRGGQGKTDTSEPVGSGSLREVSVSGGTMTENVSSIVTGPSGKGSPVTLSVDMSDKKYKSETSDSKFTSSASQSLSASVSTGKSQKFSQSEETTDVTREEYMSSINESKSAVEDVRQSESSYLSGTTVSSELGRVLTTSEKLSASSAQPSVPPSDLESNVISSNLTSATSKEDTLSPPIGTSITSETNDSISSYIPELSKKEEVPSSDVLTLSSSLSTASKSGTSSSKLSGIDPRDLPAILRTGTQQPLIIPLNDIYSSVTVSHISNTSSNATTHMQESDKTGDSASIRNTSQLSSDVYSTSITTSSAGSKSPPAGGTTTPTESSEAHGDLRSQPSRSLEMSYHPSDYTKAGSVYSSSVTNSIATSRTSRSEAESTTDVANEPMLLTNVVLTEALLRSEPSRSDFEESDILTSSSDEFITHRLMPDTFHSHDRGFLETSSAITEATESMDIGPRDVPREENVEEPTGEKLDTIIDENTVQEIPWLTDVQSGYLPVLLEESEESDDNIHTKVEEVEKSDASAFSDLEEGDIRDTSALQQQFSMIRVSESSTTNGDKSSSDDQVQHLLMIDIDGNENIFDDKLITGDTSISSISSEYLPIKMPEALPLISSEHVKYDFTETECAREIVHYVTLNAVATVVVEIVVNAAIARLTDELDFSLQMEKALFPGIEEEDGDGLIHKHWIAPARYRQKGYAQSQSFEGKGYGGYKWERSCKHRDRDEEEEAFLLCLERAFFPCLADSDDRGIGRSSSPPESEYQPSPKVSLKAKVDKTDWKTKLCKSCQLIIMASRVSTVAVGTLSQIWSIVTHWWWMIWIYIHDNCKVSKVKRKDQSTQYDEDLATFLSQTGVVIGISDEECSSVRESSTRVPKVSGWEQSDELSLNIKACRIVVSAVTGALWGKEYALSSSSSGLHRKSQPRGDDLSTTPPNGRSLVTQQFDEEYRLRLSATNVIEEDNGNGFVMNDSIRASASATPTEDSNQSEDTSLCSETDSKVDSDATGISSCSLSDITFMRQQLAEMRDIFQTHISGVQANAFSTPAVAPIPTEDAVFSSSYLEESAVCRDMTMIRDEIDGANKSVSSTKTREKGKTAAGNERIPVVDVCTNVDSQKSRKQSPKLDKSLKASKADYNPTMSEHVVKDDLELSSSKETESCKKDMFESKIVYSKLETRQGETGILDEKNKVQNKIDEPLQHLPRSELHGEEAVNINDTGECDSNSNDSSVISISDDHLSGISFIREQLANVKTLATSIMDDFDSYAEERALLAKRSSQLTCSGVLVRSQSSSDSARTIHNKSSGSSSSLNLNRDSKLGESKDFSSHEENNELREYIPDLDQDSKEDDTLVGMRKVHVVSQISGSLELPNKNGNAKTRKSGLGAEDYAKNEEQRDNLKCENTKEKGYTNETPKRQAALVGKKQTHSGAKATKETVRESLQVIGEDDQTRSLRMTETHQTRQIATFQRNSPIRRHVTPRKKEVNHPHGTYSGESTCSTDHSSSIVSRPSSSFSDGSVSSGSKRVTIESESQGRGTTDVSCRISDRGVWVNTAFVNVIDEDHLGNTSMAADSGRSSATTIKNKIMINVKTSQKNRKKHHSHRVRAGVSDTQLQLLPEENQRALAILDEESLEKKSQDMTKNKMSTNVREEVIRRSEAKSSKTVAEDSHTTDINAHDEVIEAKNCQRQSNRSSPKYEMSEGNRHGAMQLSDKLTPRKKSSSDSQCSEEYEKAVSKSTWTANQEHVMRDCLSDGAVSEKQQFLNRRQPSPKRKTRETELQDRSCHTCAEKSDHAEDLLAAPVISRSERTKAVLSMLDDVADNLSLDTSVHDNSGRARTMGRMGSFRKLFHSRKNKRQNGGKMPDHSPRVLSDSSVTESDGDSGSPSYSSDSSHTPRSSSAASLLSNVLRNLSARRSKKKSKGTSSRTPKDRRSKKGSIAAFDEMLADLDDDCFIDDAFPSLVSVRDSASEDNASLKEVLQDLIEEWSFDGLQEAIDFSPQSIGDRIRGKLNRFMAEVRKEKRRAELLFARARTL